MRYYIKRDLNEYGPYTLADLERYVAQGNIVLTDLARSEGMTDWAPVAQILGTIPVAAPPSIAAPAASQTVYAGSSVSAPSSGLAPGYGAGLAAASRPIPPDLHWALVLVISFFCGIFSYVWLFIEASFVKKLKPDADFLAFLIAGVSGTFGSLIALYAGLIAMAIRQNDGPPMVLLVLFGLVDLASTVLYFVGIFKMRRAIQEYYNTVEPINLRLSGVMTFFFNVFYFQYHFTRIVEWKKTGYLQPQG
jgi:GYF domain 2